MVFIFITTSVSAFEFDNIKSTGGDGKAGYPDVEIKNLFGFGRTLWSGELKENTPSCGSSCSAEKEITIYDTGSLVEEIKFLTLKEDETWVEQPVRSYQFYIQTGEIQSNISDYEYQCGPDGVYQNGTKKEVCANVLVGSHIETEKTWTDYSLGEEVEAGTYYVKLEGEKKQTRTVDWVIKSQGIWIDDWAVWGASNLTIGLVSYYSLEGLQSFVKDELNINNLTNVSADAGVTGKVNKAYNFTGSAYAHKISPVGLPVGNENRTVAFWFFLNADITDVNGRYLMSYGSTSSTNQFFSPRFTPSQTNKLGFMANGANDFDPSIPIIIKQWYHVAYTINGTHLSIYVNGVLNASASIVLNTVDLEDLVIGARDTGSIELHVNATIDELGIWNRTLSNAEISRLYNLGNGLAYPFASTVNLNSPANNAVSSTPTILFNATAIQPNATIVNMTLYTNQSGSFQPENITTGLSGNENETTWNHTIIGDGSYLWGVQACDSDGDCGFSFENRTITIDTSPPIINITFPISPIRYHEIGNNLTINWTVTDLSLDSCFYNYNFTTNVSVVCSANTTQFNIIESSNRNLTFFANDSNGEENSTFFSWEYSAFKESETFNSETIEGNLETFSLNLTISLPGIITNVNFTYNGTGFPAVASTTATNTIITSTFAIPSVDSTVNRSFFWSFDVDGVGVNTSSSNQSVTDFNVDNCTTNTNIILNFSVVDEEFQTTLLADIEVDVNVFNSDRSITVANFSGSFNSTSAAICLNTPLLNTTLYFLDSIVKYSAPGYEIEYYNILNSTLTNNTAAQNITLFDLNSTDSTPFRITFVGENFLPVEGILVFLDRQYVSEGTFKTVELPITDPNGQTILHLVRNDVIYNIRFLDGSGNILGNFQEITAFCEDPLLQNCQIALSSSPNISSTFNYDELTGLSFSSSPVFNSTTNFITFDFFVPGGVVKTVAMNVTRNDVFGNRTICENSVTSTSGTLFCAVDPAISDTSLSSVITVNGETVLLSSVQIDSTGLGSIGYVLWFILTLVLVFTFGDSKNTALFSLLISYVGAVLLGISRGNIIGFGAAGTWIIIITVLGIWRLNREKVQ